MIFTIKKHDLPKMEMFLFKLNYPCDCFIKIICEDSNETFEYKTINIDGYKVLITQ